jgi:D-alanyl-D-alanine dipeptidase
MPTSLRSLRTLGGVWLVALLACASAPGDPAGEPLVDVGASDPELFLDIRYAGEDNFLGRAVYDAPRCLLVQDAAERLREAERRLRADGYGLVIWDCYRPRSVQYAMWEILPDPDYVADPDRGSRHNRGAAVDVGIRALDGRELVLPTDHDDFTPRAHRDATDLPAAAIETRERLERAMTSAGWIPLPTEWWHFDAPGWERYPLRDESLSSAATGSGS